MSKFAKALRKERERQKVSRGGLSIKSGISYTHLQRLELGEKPPGTIGIAVLIKLSKALDWPVDTMAEIIEEDLGL